MKTDASVCLRHLINNFGAKHCFLYKQHVLYPSTSRPIYCCRLQF